MTTTRKGDEVFIDGSVDHGIDDLYDFNDDDWWLKSVRRPAETGQAAPFRIRSKKTDRVQGKIKLKNGMIADHEFLWTPYTPKDNR